MNKKEKDELNKLSRNLDFLFNIVLNLEKYCLSQDVEIFATIERTKQYKKVLLKSLNKIQNSVDKMFGIDVYVKPNSDILKMYKN